LAKDPDERWQTARDLGRELEWIALGGSQAGVPAPAVKRRRLGLSWMVAFLAVLAAAVVSWLHFSQSAQPVPMVHFTVPLPATPGFVAGPLLSPNGALAALWLGDSINWQIYLYTLATGELRPLPNSAKATKSSWSPDSRYLAAANSGGGALRKIDVATGAVSV